MNEAILTVLCIFVLFVPRGKTGAQNATWAVVALGLLVAAVLSLPGVLDGH